MQRIQRYLFIECIRIFCGLLLLVVSILLLERLLRIADLVSRSPGNLSEAIFMLGNLIPHYAGIGIPAAFFLAVLITISRISRSGELVAIWGMGQSLFMISAPFMIIATGLASVLLFTTALLQPLSRYEYRSLVSSIAESSIETVFMEGKFVEAGDWTVWTEGVDLRNGDLDSSFILERLRNGASRVIVAKSGALVRGDGSIQEIRLIDGMGAGVRADQTLGSKLEFDTLNWSPPEALSQFRARGKDIRELTLSELWAYAGAQDQRPNTGIRTVDAMVSIHDQLARFALIFILPLIAVPFGLSYGRNPPSNAILIGLVTLIIIQQLLELAKSLALDGALPPWAGSWTVILIVGALAVMLYRRSALTIAQPPLSALPAIQLPRLLTQEPRSERDHHDAG